MARYPKIARWRGPIPNMTPNEMVRPILGLVLHIECGTEKGTNSWFHNRAARASAHFGNPKRFRLRLDQWVDTDDRAWAEVNGNSRWISIENAGNSGAKLTRGQIRRAAKLLAVLHIHEGVPLRITDKVTQGGLGWHGMGGAAWGGHTSCPGERIKAQRPEIIAQARKIVDKHHAKPRHRRYPGWAGH